MAAPKTRAEWIVILDLMRMIRLASAEERRCMRDLLQKALEKRKTE